MKNNRQNGIILLLRSQHGVQSDCGVVAQLGERLNGIQEVRGSIPRGSTICKYLLPPSDRITDVLVNFDAADTSSSHGFLLPVIIDPASFLGIR